MQRRYKVTSKHDSENANYPVFWLRRQSRRNIMFFKATQWSLSTWHWQSQGKMPAYQAFLLRRSFCVILRTRTAGISVSWSRWQTLPFTTGPYSEGHRCSVSHLSCPGPFQGAARRHQTRLAPFPCSAYHCPQATLMPALLIWIHASKIFLQYFSFFMSMKAELFLIRPPAEGPLHIWIFPFQ